MILSIRFLPRYFSASIALCCFLFFLDGITNSATPARYKSAINQSASYPLSAMALKADSRLPKLMPARNRSGALEGYGAMNGVIASAPEARHYCGNFLLSKMSLLQGFSKN
jgi:hypothetical protein